MLAKIIAINCQNLKKDIFTFSYNNYMYNVLSEQKKSYSAKILFKIFQHFRLAICLVVTEFGYPSSKW
jgi:hypothetical protein